MSWIVEDENLSQVYLGTTLGTWRLAQGYLGTSNGLIIVEPDPEQDLINVMEYFGESNVPRDVWRRRKSNMDAMKRFGSPVIIKHMYNDEDVQEGRAVRSPNFDDDYGQTRNRDPLSHGAGFVGAVDGQMILSSNEWYRSDGTGGIIKSTTQPAEDYLLAPKYRGYGPGHLTYVIMPDVSEDVFKMSEGGVLIRTQQARVQMGWYPEANDNDLLITCQVDRAYNVVKTFERYELKQTNPVSIRGLDRKGRREYTEDFGNRHVVQQEFEMSLIPKHNELMNVDVDR